MTSVLTINSATNFDFSSLHLLRQEIKTILKDAEVHLREFYDDQEQAPLLSDSVTNLSQLAKVFGLIYFDGASVLAQHLADAYDALHHTDPDKQIGLMTDVSEAVMVLDRYVEFVLLKETVEPTLLLPIINKLRQHLNKEPLAPEVLKQDNHSVVINNPNDGYVPLIHLGLNTDALVQSYRMGLSVILNHKAGSPLSNSDHKKLADLAQVCATIANASDVLFWQAAAILTKDIAQDLPLSDSKKRILIYLEQQLKDYLPIEDRRFAELVSFACRKDRQFAQLAGQKYALNQVSPAQFEQMQRFLFGPNLEITQTINALIQEDIESIKQHVDTLVRTDGQTLEGDPITPASIAKELSTLSKALHLLGLQRASDALLEASAVVNAWHNPDLNELESLMDKLLIAENAAIFLAKSHTPGAIKFPLHNTEISLHHLDVAYETLVKEARHTLMTISATLSSFLSNAHQDGATLQDVPEMIRQVSGAAAFLHMPIVNRQLTRLANKLERELLGKLGTLSDNERKQIINRWADVLVAADMALENFAENHPTNRQALLISEHSLNYLLAA